ncbi:5-formyltetrahydrofolate cyclo-ligase [Parvibium lacunae]|nr:5-formyltetrahydrofolate cyclo-ligase [Parvibium lacunae]
MDKATLRRQLLQQRAAFSAASVVARDLHIQSALDAWYQAAASTIGLPQEKPWLGVYWPLKHEVDLHPLYQRWWAQGHLLALPEAETGKPLRFRAWAAGQPMVADAYGLPIPAAAHYVQPAALLIPCVGFTKIGYRLGYGGGFYDRTLAAYAARCTTVGVADSRCELAHLPVEQHDLPLQLICTQDGWHKSDDIAKLD